jgi:EAL domain-containing protein (putative c-di-GMP-specific phosphodiesterase class I)
VLRGKAARVGVSVGAVLATKNTADASELVRKADITMYRAKESGRNCFRLFSDEMDAAVQRRDQLESALREALDTGTRLELQFQPQLDSRGAVTGVEGLLRWQDPVLGDISPSEAVPIAAECGLIDKLGEFTFAKACEAAKRWPDLSIAVNLSPLQFRSEDLPSRLVRTASEHGVSCEQIELEITESVFVEHGDFCEQAIRQLRASGFRIALDDFGTGYSSLSYLQRFPVDTIKLDRSFLNSNHPAGNIPIIRAAVTLGHALDLQVMAEGIATKEQEQVALEAGCDGLQGHLYAPAMRQEALDAYLKLGSRPRLASAA